MSILTEVEDSLRELAFDQILYTIGHDSSNSFDQNTFLTNGAFYSGFSLCCCLIETCGHYLTGTSGDGTSRASFLAFGAYLTQLDARYNPDVLYKALRCGLLHNFTPSSNRNGVRDFYELVHNKPGLHLTTRPNPNASPTTTSTLGTPASGTVLAAGSTVAFASAGTYLNIQNLVADLQSAMNQFFADAHSTPSIEAKVEQCARDNGYPGVR